MSASYVRDKAKVYVGSGLTTPFHDTENFSKDPKEDAWLTLDFNAEYVDSKGVNKCSAVESGVIDLVFMFKSGKGDALIKQAEADAKLFYHNKDPSDTLVFTGMQALESFNDASHYRVVIGIEYNYKFKL